MRLQDDQAENMDNDSLFSRESFITASSSGHHFRLGESVSRFAKFLQPRASRTSLRSEVTVSSGWSRALVPWWPRMRYSIDESRNVSTTTVSVYPTRDPARLQSLLQAPTSPATNTGEPQSLDVADLGAENGGQYPSKGRNLIQAPSPLTLEEIAFADIATNVQKHVEVLDESFAAALDSVYALDRIMELFCLHKQDQQEVEAEFDLTLAELSSVLSTPKSIYIAIFLFSLVAYPRYNKALRLILRHLCDAIFLEAHTNDVLCSCALALAAQPGRSMKLAGEFQHCLIDNLTRHLPPMSPTALFCKSWYCVFLIGTHDKAAARTIWKQINLDDFGSVQDDEVRLGLLEEWYISFSLEEYAVVKRHCTMVIEVADSMQALPWRKAFQLELLAHSNIELGLHETALQQAAIALTLLTEDDVLTVDARHRVQDLMRRIEDRQRRA